MVRGATIGEEAPDFRILRAKVSLYRGLSSQAVPLRFAIFPSPRSCLPTVTRVVVRYGGSVWY